MRKLDLRKKRASAPLPDPTESRPRAVRLTGAGRIVLVLGTLLAAASPAVGFYLVASALERRQLHERIASEGLTAHGQIISLRRTRGDKPRYLAEYQYVVDGETHKGRAALPHAAWARLNVGSPVAVRYLASQPERSWPAGLEPGLMPLWLAPLASLAMALVSALCWREILRQRRLLAEGRLTLGQVLKVNRTGRGSGAQNWSVRYEFKTLSGATIRGRGLVRGNPPDPGAMVRILYDPDDPGRNGLYPLSLVRPA